MTATLDADTAQDAFGHRLAPPGDPLEGAAFDAVFEAKIKPELVKCEAQRQGALQIFLIALVAGVVLAAVEYMFAPSMSRSGSSSPPVGFMVMTLAIAGVLGYLPLAAVSRRAKVAVLTSLCEPLGVSYQLSGGSAPAFDDFLRLRLLPQPDDKTFQDFFSGQRGGVGFQLCEAMLTEGSGKNRHTVFHGQLVCLTAAKPLGSTTVVLRNTGWFKSFECPTGLKAVGLEDPRFNQTFAVFGSDQVEARELLTPSFMQQLNDLERTYQGGHIRCAFEQALLLVALEGPNRFEIGSMFSSLLDRARVETLARNLEQVFKLIDEFRGA